MAAQPSAGGRGAGGGGGAAAPAPSSSGFSLPHTLSNQPQQQQQRDYAGDEDKERTKQSLKAWWSAFTSSRSKQQAFSPASASAVAAAAAALAAGHGHAGAPVAGAGAELPPGMGKAGGVFGVPLRTSLKYASVAISMAGDDGREYVWGYVPVIVAKIGLFLKENATQTEGVFRIAGSQKRMKELQDIFDSPPRYGKNVDWSRFSVHDSASVLRRYLNHMPEPIVPLNLYSEFKNVMIKRPFDASAAIRTYRLLITSMPAANQYLLLYVLDLLAVFARESDKNLMPPSNLAVIFQPGIFSHPSHLQNPAEHKIAVEALEFMITHQDHFVLGLSPPPPPNVRPEDLTGVSKPLTPVPQSATGIQAEDVLIPSDSDEEQDPAAFVAHRGGGAARAVAAAAAAAAAEQNIPAAKSGRRSGGKSSGGLNLGRSLSTSAKSPRRLFGGGGGDKVSDKDAAATRPARPDGCELSPSGPTRTPATSVSMSISKSAGPFTGSASASGSSSVVAQSISPPASHTGNIHEAGLGQGDAASSAAGRAQALSEAPIPAGPPPIISPPSTPPPPQQQQSSSTGSAARVRRSKTTPSRRKGSSSSSSVSGSGRGGGDVSVDSTASGGAAAGSPLPTPPSSKVLPVPPRAGNSSASAAGGRSGAS